MKNRDLSSDEIIAITTLNCCANAIRDMLPKLQRRLKATGNARRIGLAKGAAESIARVVKCMIEASPDEDQQQMVINRMSRLHLQFGHVRKHPEELVIMSAADADTLLSPVLEKCDLDCPCVLLDETGETVIDRSYVKGCEIRKALKRVGVSEVGLSKECPYQFVLERR